MSRIFLRGVFVGSLVLSGGFLTASRVSGQLVGAAVGEGPQAPKAAPAAVKSVATAEDAIEHALRQPVTLEFVETPLSDVVEYLAKYSSIQILLDKKALDEAGAATDTPISCNLQQVKLSSALDLTLDELDLDYVVRNEVLQITTKEKAEARLETKVYGVRDLVPSSDATAGVEPDFGSLIQTITKTIQPNSWGEVGGPGTIEAFPQNFTLVCSQTRRVHQQIERLLADLRRESKPEPNANEARILHALEEPTSIEFVESPLNDVVDYLKDLHKIKIEFDKKALDAAGAAKDSPISWNLQGIQLKSALKLILEELDLTYVVRNEVLLITTKETGADREPTFLKTYNVTPTTPATVAGADATKPASGAVPGDFEERLAKAIQEMVAPSSWNEDGTTAIRAIPGALLVRQTAVVHAQISKLLKELHVTAEIVPIPTSPIPVVGSIGPER